MIQIASMILLLQSVYAGNTLPGEGQARVIIASSALKLNCTGESPTWFINGVFKNTQELKDVEIKEDLKRLGPAGNGITSMLQFNASSIGNGTLFECVVNNDNGSTDTLVNISFIIQGILDPPGKFNIIAIDSSTLQLSWETPFSLDLTDHDPDIIDYSISIRNKNANAAINTTRTSYTFSGMPEDRNKPDPCNNHVFSIRARNVEGYGNSSREITTCFPAIPYQAHPRHVIFTSDRPATVTISIQINATCHGRIPDYIDVTLLTEAVSSGPNLTVINMNTYNVPKLPTGEMTFTHSVGNVSQQPKNCTVQITARNIAGSSPPTNVVFECKQTGTTLFEDDEDDKKGGFKGNIIGAILGGVLVLVVIAGVVVAVVVIKSTKQRRSLKVSRHTGRNRESNDYEENDIPGTSYIPHDQDNQQPASNRLIYADIGQSGLPLNQHTNIRPAPLEHEVEYSQVQHAE